MKDYVYKYAHAKGVTVTYGAKMPNGSSKYGNALFSPMKEVQPKAKPALPKAKRASPGTAKLRDAARRQADMDEGSAWMKMGGGLQAASLAKLADQAKSIPAGGGAGGQSRDENGRWD